MNTSGYIYILDHSFFLFALRITSIINVPLHNTLNASIFRLYSLLPADCTLHTSYYEHQSTYIYIHIYINIRSYKLHIAHINVLFTHNIVHATYYTLGVTHCTVNNIMFYSLHTSRYKIYPYMCCRVLYLL